MARSKDKSDTRNLLLETGVELLMRDGLPEAINLKLADVVTHLGMTTGAAYNIWSKQEDYQLDLALHMLDSFDWTEDFLEEAVNAGLAAGEDAESVVGGAALAYFNRLITTPEFYLTIHFWSIAEPRIELVERIRTGYQQIHEALVEIFGAALDAFGLRMRADHSLDDMSVAATAITEGAALRHRFDPDRIGNGEIYASILVALFHAYTEPVPGGA